MRTLGAVKRPFRPVPTRVPGPAAQAWRVTTAVRVFTLALVTGQVLEARAAGSVGVVLLALLPVAATCCAIELEEAWRRARWSTYAEGLVTVALVGLATGPVDSLLVYVAVPAVVAGVRHGAATTVGVTLAETAALLGLATLARSTELAGPPLEALLPWLVIGLGAGLLAASQTRAGRRLDETQAPHAAAHRLVGQLYEAAQELPLDLDVTDVARTLQDTCRATTGAERSSVWVRGDAGDLEVLASHGRVGEAEEGLAGAGASGNRPVLEHGAMALPLRVGDRLFGALVLTRPVDFAAATVGEVQERLDEQAIRLDTALLLDEVRALAMTEERSRLARDIHDGVAQQLVRLGYLADDVAALTDDPVARQGVDELRAEVTRVVRALRFSVFDLRQGVEEAGSLSGALAEYVRELETSSDLRIHLALDERHSRLSRRTEEELYRIAQEAIGNAHRHARASNLWVRLSASGPDLRLVVEDDGVGSALPRPGHFGLHTMRERAQRIRAELDVRPRSSGGTVVTVQSLRPADQPGEERHDHPRLARR